MQRAGLSALGIAIGVAAIVAVLGLSASSQAGLLDEIDRLGTNLLTVSNGQSLTGGPTELPTTAPGTIGRISGVQQVQSTGAVSGTNAFRTPYIPSVDTNGLTVQAHRSTSSQWSPRPLPRATTSTRPPSKNPSPSSERPPPNCSVSTASTPVNGSGWAANDSTSPASSNPRCSHPPSTPPSWSATPRQRNT
ncbi:MAG: ABC transporter permease [Solirubrobacteraceae bacterium]